ncbi:MAG: hypothetical protein BWY09_01120 [Candidatus Hydrogenedentes bacterium ADurb.Bin179]|nr:MAG: hypothetical protein BWY09_01120 [Candidatus Hydrogenedentes bacterium ADurb.Bin179]
MNGRVIVFKGDNIINLFVYDSGGNVFLAPHCVQGYDTSFELERMAAIEETERGKFSQMPGRSYYNLASRDTPRGVFLLANLQEWRNGRNEVHYIPTIDVAETKNANAGYQLFCKLAEHYADEVIE